MAEIKTTIPKGSWILVTGASGFVATHVVKEFLQRGYKVRGTVRDLDKYSWLVQDLFKTDADNNNFDIVQVPDLAAEHAFDAAVKDVSAIVHIATIGFDPNPNNVIPKVVAGTKSLLEAAMKEPSVQQFDYTSSVAAMITPQLSDTSRLTADTWNDEAVEQAWAPPPYEPSRAWAVYAASKTLAEKAVWEFVNENTPEFAVNAVVPATVLGECLSKTHAELGHMWPKILYEGNPDAVAAVLAMPGRE
jgi:nucleoside-diphosphate-sugar epimerase